MREKNKSFSSEWHNAETVQPLVQCYRNYIDLVMLKEINTISLVQCRDCEISFLTSKSNHERNDLRCPFGCREHYKQSTSRTRSDEYYKTEEGQAKKADLNRRRSSKDCQQIEVQENKSKKENLSLQERYYLWLINKIEKILLNIELFKELLNIIYVQVRQRSLVEKSSLCDIPDD